MQARFLVSASRALNYLLGACKLHLGSRRTFVALLESNAAYLDLLQTASTPCADSRLRRPRAEGIIFSKDRAFQLHALLTSYFTHVTPAVPLHVLYKASDAAHRQAYEEVLAEFAGQLGSAREESQFRYDVLEELEQVQAPKVFFLTDDDVFIEPVDLDDFAAVNTTHFVPSLRLGENLRRTYTYNVDQPLPPFQQGLTNDPQKLGWIWKEGVQDWAYPLSVDGHLFGTAEMRVLARHTPFSSPNSFEGNLQRFQPIFCGRAGLCYRKARLVNIPCNRVQNEVDNLHGGQHKDLLLDKWRQGLRMDVAALHGYINISAHQEITFGYIPRTPAGAASDA